MCKWSSKPYKEDYQGRDSLSNGGLVPNEPRVWKRHTKNDASAFQGGDIVWIPSESKFGGVSISSTKSMGISSPQNLSCNLWDKDWVCESIVLKNMSTSLKGEVFGGVFELGLLVQSYLFGLGSRDKGRSTCVLFPNEGAGGHYHKRPTYRLPIIGNMSFFLCRTKKWLLAWLTNFQLGLGRTIEVDRLVLRKCFQPLPLHISIRFYWRIILLFISRF